MSRFAALAEHRAEIIRFLLTGGVAYGTDVALFNVFLWLVPSWSPATSKWISGLIAIVVAFIGSRYYTWSHRPKRHVVREYSLFLLFSLLAAGIQVLFVFVSHELMGFTSKLADNISGNILGMAVAMAFRFYTFRTFVFPDEPEDDESGSAPATGSVAAAE